MKKTYSKPFAEVIAIEAEDIITASSLEFKTYGDTSKLAQVDGNIEAALNEGVITLK